MATPDQKNATVLSEQAIALAEELGRIAGTIEGTAESWLNRQSLAEQLTRVRDGAAEMLESLTAGAERGRAAATGSVQTIAADVRRKASQALAAASAGRAAQKAKKGSKKTKPATAQAAVQRPDPSRAPGKQRRKPAPTMRGLKKSDERIPKLRTAAAVRQRRKLHA